MCDNHVLIKCGMVIVMKIADIVQGVVDSSSPASLSIVIF